MPEPYDGLSADPETALAQVAELAEAEYSNEEAQEPEEGAEVEAVETSDEPSESPQPELKYEQIGENRYRWEDGLITDADGNEIAEEAPAKPAKAAPQTATVSEEAKKVQWTPETTQQAQGQPQQDQIYSVERLYNSIYTQEALTEISEMAFTDAVGAERKRLALQAQYEQGKEQIRRYASQKFNAGLEHLATVTPKATERYSKDILLAKESMSPEDMQRPGAAAWELAKCIMRQMMNDPMAVEEFVTRTVPKSYANAGTGRPTGQPAVQSAPTSPKPATAPAPKRVIPASMRPPTAGSARRTVKQREETSADPQVRIYMQMGYTKAEAEETAASLREMDRRAKAAKGIEI